MTQIESVTYRGVGASPGIAIAKAHVVQADEYVPEQAVVENVGAEAERFHAAVVRAREELEQLRERTERRLGQEHAEIFEGHLMILEDPELIDAVMDRIREGGINAEYALHETAQYFIQALLELEDETLRARAADVHDIGGRIMAHLRGQETADLSLLKEECVVIAEDLTPSDTAGLNLEAVRGFVTEVGSRTSHSAIMARSLGIPAVVGAGEALKRIRTGMTIVLDAEEGVVIVDPSPDELARYRKKKEQYDRKQAELKQWRSRPSTSSDGKRVELAANIGSLEDVQKAIDNGAEGIGLFRTEFLYMGRSDLPSEEEQYNSYKYVLEKMNGKPVVIRTLDIGGDKELPYLNLPKESNPFLGRRALRLCLERPELLRTQLRALLRASRCGNLKIMFPMIAVLDELRAAKAILEEERTRLIAEGEQPAEHIEVGMMIEVPAAALAAHLFAKEVDFFSIGTNDLIQYTMAADRMNETVAYLNQPCHPVILRLIRMVVEAADREGRWVGMCGEMAGDETAIPLLLGLGLHEFSMSAGSILQARKLVAGLDSRKWAALAEQAMMLDSQAAVHAWVREQLVGGNNV